MASIRLLALAPLPALVSCSASIWNTGRDPAELLGRSRPSIHSEFGKPAKTTTRVTGSPIDYIHVRGSWKDADVANALILVDTFTLGVLEPIYTVQSAAQKSAVTKDGQYLELSYHRGSVMDARLTPSLP